MKRVFLAMAIVLLLTGQSFAAGSGWTVLENDEGYLDSSLGGVIGLPREGTSDASDASVPVWPDSGDSAMSSVAGCMIGYVIKCGATGEYPTSIVVSFKDKYGGIINPDTDDTVNTCSSAGLAFRVKFDTPECIAGGLYADFTVVGNSKKFKVIPLFLR